MVFSATTTSVFGEGCTIRMMLSLLYEKHLWNTHLFIAPWQIQTIKVSIILWKQILVSPTWMYHPGTVGRLTSLMGSWIWTAKKFYHISLSNISFPMWIRQYIMCYHRPQTAKYLNRSLIGLVTVTVYSVNSFLNRFSWLSQS